jgi:hypothetical protein
VIIRRNKGGYSGPAFFNNVYAAPILTNVLITGNSVVGYNDSPGIFVPSGHVELRNITIVGNVPTNPSVPFALQTNGGSIGVYNSIIYGGVYGSNISIRTSIVEGRADVANGNLDATGITPDDIFTNPSGGDYSLKNGSPAVDKGDEGWYEGLTPDTKDLAGNARVYQFNGGVIDLGAYESAHSAFPYFALSPDANGVMYVRETALGDRSGSSWANATDKLKRAIHIDNVKQVWAAVGNYSAKYIGLKNGVAIYGGFDPDNLIDDLTDTRILPQPENDIAGSVLNAQQLVQWCQTIITVWIILLFWMASH